MASFLSSKLLALPSNLRVAAWRQATLHATRASSVASRPFSTASPGHETPPHSSVNHTEITHFTNLASSWWDPHGSSRLLHLMNPLRHDFINRCYGTSSTFEQQSGETGKRRGISYLDIGCGGGIFAESAARLPNTASVTAIDPTPECIAVAKQHQRSDPALMEEGRLRYLNTAIENLPEYQHQQEQDGQMAENGSPGEYDIVTLFEVIEHIQSPAPFLASCLRHLKPGGWLVGSTIARTGTSWVTTKLFAEDVLGIVPRGTHEWSQYILPAELRTWAGGRRELEIGAGGGTGWVVMGVVYVPGLGWREVKGSEEWGNYFFAMRKSEDANMI